MNNYYCKQCGKLMRWLKTSDGREFVVCVNSECPEGDTEIITDVKITWHLEV